MARFISGIREMSYSELTKDHNSCIEQERTTVNERLVAKIVFVIDLKASDTESKNLVI
jgi:hypothetical protein